jgi:hypothetical protein
MVFVGPAGVATLKELEEIIAESHLPSMTLRAPVAERMIEILNWEKAAGTMAEVG